MDHSVLNTLFAADDQSACEYPANFDWKRAVARVHALKPICDGIAGQSFDIDDQVQDASFFADIALHAPSRQRQLIDTVFGLRFSCFGQLFTRLGPTGEAQLPPTVTQQVIDAGTAAGFVYIPPEALDERYSGANPVFDGQTWWYRYFEYL